MCCAVVRYYILWHTVHLACSHGPYTVDHHSLQSVQSVHEQSKNHTCNPAGLDEIIHCTECVSAFISYINAILHEMTVSIYQSPQHSWWGLVLAKMCAVLWTTWPWPFLYFVGCPWCSVCMWVLCCLLSKTRCLIIGLWRFCKLCYWLNLVAQCSNHCCIVYVQWVLAYDVMRYRV